MLFVDSVLIQGKKINQNIDEQDSTVFGKAVFSYGVESFVSTQNEVNYCLTSMEMMHSLHDI